MIDREDFRAAWDALGPFVPPLLGAFIGLRYATDAPLRDRALTWLFSAAAGIYLGGALAEYYTLGVRTAGGAMFLIAMFGSELFAVAIAALKQWSADPVGTFRRWRNAVLGRSDA